MTSRERVMNALNFRPVDRLPCDLGAMRTTGISAFAYHELVTALGLPPRRPRIHNSHRMLALPDPDVLDALGCDVLTIDSGVTNAFEEPTKWKDFDFGGRLAARVRVEETFDVDEHRTVWQHSRGLRMVHDAYVFGSEHNGQAMLGVGQPLPLLDLVQYRKQLAADAMTDEEVKAQVDLCRRVRESSDRAIVYTGHLEAGISITSHGGVGIFPIICMLEPAYVNELHGITIEHMMGEAAKLVPQIAPYVDVILTADDDWGTQVSPIASPQIFWKLFVPYYRRYNAEIHRLARGVKTFLHSCGAIYELLGMMAEAGFDVINPVQWPAGGRTHEEWKARVRGKASLWGGGVDAQHTLTWGTLEEVDREVRSICRTMGQGGGYVFNNIDNLMAEVTPERVIAMYAAAQSTPVGP